MKIIIEDTESGISITTDGIENMDSVYIVIGMLEQAKRAIQKSVEPS